MTQLQSKPEKVNAMTAGGELPGVEISDKGVKSKAHRLQSWLTTSYHTIKSQKCSTK